MTPRQTTISARELAAQPEWFERQQAGEVRITHRWLGNDIVVTGVWCDPYNNDIVLSTHERMDGHEVSILCERNVELTITHLSPNAGQTDSAPDSAEVARYRKALRALWTTLEDIAVEVLYEPGYKVECAWCGGEQYPVDTNGERLAKYVKSKIAELRIDHNLECPTLLAQNALDAIGGPDKLAALLEEDGADDAR